MELETLYIIVAIILPTIAIFAGIYYLLKGLNKPVEHLDES